MLSCWKSFLVHHFTPLLPNMERFSVTYFSPNKLQVSCYDWELWRIWDSGYNKKQIVAAKMIREDCLKKISLPLSAFSVPPVCFQRDKYTPKSTETLKWTQHINFTLYTEKLPFGLTLSHNEGCMEITLYFGLNWS